MPIVAHNNLPTFDKLRNEGLLILEPTRALTQHIRELHIGLLNMMPDAALQATELQFFRLIGDSNPIAQFYVHPFTLDSLPRGEEARAHIAEYYETFEQIRAQGLDALIITGANVTGPDLSSQPFWQPLIEVAEWSHQHVTSTLCSCLATHAVMEFRYGQVRHPQKTKKWGVYQHKLTAHKHPLTVDINTRFEVPHSRWNAVTLEQFKQAGLHILATELDDGCVHLASSADGIRTVFFQGHPEYDTISLLKEFKREVYRFINAELETFPPFPENYLGLFEAAVLSEYRYYLLQAMRAGTALPEFPEQKIVSHLNNSWCDTADAVMGNWIGLIYQLTHKDRDKPFMDGIDINNPLGLAPVSY
ncbi:MAG: homoserine O-succinyltransferase [Gammaproteobacteria bacterium]|nr:homoserine O-succinyltransferase [Gammaproteobacteria bacterium]